MNLGLAAMARDVEMSPERVGCSSPDSGDGKILQFGRARLRSDLVRYWC